MALERRDGIVRSGSVGQPFVGRSLCCETKPFSITKRQVFEAYKKVKANRGSAGVDQQSLEDFETDLSGNLYKLWNRMASGSYHHWKLPCWQDLDITGIAGNIWSQVQGWINYYGRFGIYELRRVLYHMDEHIIRWIQRKYKKLRRRSRAFGWFRRIRKDHPALFAHWRFRIEGGWTIGAV